MAALRAFQGTALLGPRTNAKTAEFAIPLPLPPNLPDLDAVVARVESLPPDVTVPLQGGGAFHRWREKLEGAAEVVESTQDGLPALLRAGGLHYLCGWPDAAALDRILTQLCHGADLPTHPMPHGLRRRRAGDVTFLFNYNPHEVTFNGHTLKAADVHWSIP